MPASNDEVADAFDELADLLQLQSANVFRVQAYRRAARMLRGLERPLVRLVEEGADLEALPGIGPDLATKIQAFVNTRSFPALDEARKKTPAGVRDLLRLPDLGPKRVQTIHRELGVTSIEGLREAARAGRLRDLPGMGPTTEAKVLRAVERRAAQAGRHLMVHAWRQAQGLVAFLRDLEAVEAAEAAGSLRRGRTTVKDIDLVAASDDPGVVAAFGAHEDVAEVLSAGTTRTTVRLRTGIQVDLRVVPPGSYGAALCYFTGSKDHNIRLRRLALRQGLSLNEYGLHNGGTVGRTEQEVYAALGLPWIAPEMREDQGEFAAAAEGRLPDLVTQEEIQGDLHMHTDASDGRADVETMLRAAAAQGHAYVAITDHSPHPTVAQGLDERSLARHAKTVRATEVDGITALAGVEVDVAKDGSLDLPASALRDLDVVVASLHSHLDLPEDEQTARVVKVLEHPHVDILGHPTGRRLLHREGARLDVERVMQAAADTGTVLEVDSQPDRLDLDGALCRRAKEAGVRVSVSTDAHAAGRLGTMRFGVQQARRGWLEKDDVVNTRDLEGLRRCLKRGAA